MKRNFTLLSIIIAVIAMIMSSCVTSDKVSTSNFIQKRKYNKGYFVDVFSKKQKTNEINTDSEVRANVAGTIAPTENESAPKNTITEENKYSDNLIASTNDNAILASLNNESELQNTIKNLSIKSSIQSEAECDIIILKNGSEIEAKVLEISTDEIKYKKCDNVDGPTYSIKKSEVFMIKYKNGTKDIITQNNTTTSTDNSSTSTIVDKTQKNTKEKKSGAFGIVSLATGIVGLLIASIIMGPIAMAFGIVGMINRKLKGLAIAGLIIGIIDVVAGIILLTMYIY